MELRGEVSGETVEYARTTVLDVARRANEPVLFVRVRLTQGRDPGVRRSAVARASMDVNGRPARARVAAETMREAIDLLSNRLDYRVARLEHWRLWPGPMSTDPYEWQRLHKPKVR
ncbi:hypothetical protein ACIRYZ_22900 [Kitasatospora sp. NPDC101155]|uniref:hypothetical protein n=1 Tax=Kitasatospora sp. NPDC101155 TaxID=3364097 RepID=UPI003828890F